MSIIFFAKSGKKHFRSSNYLNLLKRTVSRTTNETRPNKLRIAIKNANYLRKVPQEKIKILYCLTLMKILTVVT